MKPQTEKGQLNLFDWRPPANGKAQRSEAARRAAATRRARKARAVAEGVAEFNRQRQVREEAERQARERQEAQERRPAWSYSTWQSGRSSVVRWYLWEDRSSADALRQPKAQGERRSVQGQGVVLERVAADLRALGVEPVLVPGAARRWYHLERERDRARCEQYMREADQRREQEEAERRQAGASWTAAEDWRRLAEEVGRQIYEEVLRRLGQPQLPTAALQLLGLDPAGSVDELAVARAYKLRALATHPDRGGTAEAFDAVAKARNEVMAWVRSQAS